MGGEGKKGSKALYFSVLASEALFYSKIHHFRQIYCVLLSGYDTVSGFHWRVPCQCRRALNSLSLSSCVCVRKRGSSGQKRFSITDSRRPRKAASAASERRPPPQQSAALECRRREEEKWKGEDGQIYTRKDSSSSANQQLPDLFCALNLYARAESTLSSTNSIFCPSCR